MMPRSPRADLIFRHADLTFCIFQALLDPKPLHLLIEQFLPTILVETIIRQRIFDLRPIEVRADDQPFVTGGGLFAIPRIDVYDRNSSPFCPFRAVTETQRLEGGVGQALGNGFRRHALRVDTIAGGRASSQRGLRWKIGVGLLEIDRLIFMYIQDIMLPIIIQRVPKFGIMPIQPISADPLIADALIPSRTYHL